MIKIIYSCNVPWSQDVLYMKISVTCQIIRALLYPSLLEFKTVLDKTQFLIRDEMSAFKFFET